MVAGNLLISRLLISGWENILPLSGLVLTVLLAGCGGPPDPRPDAAKSSGGSVVDTTFTNPVDTTSADPWVVRHNGTYYYTRTTGHSVRVWRAEKLHRIHEGPGTLVWDPPSGTMYSEQLWAPELHYLDGRWYVYVAASDGANRNHRMYVLESRTDDPQGAYRLKGKIAAPTDRWAIDGTVLEGEGRRYFVWSGWKGTENTGQHLYIAPMANPWTIEAERTRIASPRYDWERHGLPINEGPQVIETEAGLFLAFSASGFWTPEYSIGLLAHTGGSLTDSTAWEKQPKPGFTGVGTPVDGTGHASFTRSCDGSERWIVYHAHHRQREDAPPVRDLRMQPYDVGPEGRPRFDAPVLPGEPIPIPSGC